jgi:hypothetical protein
MPMPTSLRISFTSKLGTPSWSLTARDDCPGSVDPVTGDLVPACKGCYAAFGNYRYKNVQAPRLHNREDWKTPDWEDRMVSFLIDNKVPHFRWFDSGDAYAIKLARKMLGVMRRTPGTKHWLPTRMHKFAKFRPVLTAMQLLPNVMVRPSSDEIDGTYDPALHGSVIYDPAGPAPKGTYACPAYKNDGQCGTCRACYDKNINVIAYPARGRVMLSQIKRRAAKAA